MEAITYVLRNRGGFGPDYLPKFDTAPFEDVPNQFRNLVSEWYLIARGSGRTGLWNAKTGRHARVAIRGTFLLEHIDKAMNETAPLVQALRAEGDASTAQWLKTEFFRHVVGIRTRGRREEARDSIDVTAKRVGGMLGPEAAATEKQTRETVLLALGAVGKLDNLLDLHNDVLDKINIEVGRALQQGSVPASLQMSKGSSAIQTLDALGDVLSGVRAVMEITDPELRTALFNQKLGAWGHVKAVADLGIKIGAIAQSVITVTSLVAAGACTALGYAREAAKLWNAVGQLKLTTFTGHLGKAMGALSIVTGTIAVLHPKSTASARASGVADIASGSAAIVGGAVGSGLVGAALAFKVNLKLLEMATGAAEGLVWVDLSQCYQAMKSNAEAMANSANKVIAAQALLEAESDPVRRAYLDAELASEARFLHRLLSFFLDAPQRQRDLPLVAYPGSWPPLRRRFAKATPWPIRNPSPAHLVNATGPTLRMVESVFADRRGVLREATWKK